MLTGPPPSIDGEIASAPVAAPVRAAAAGDASQLATLDEPVLTTITRDLKMVARKLRVVLLPLQSSGGSRAGAAAGAGGATAGADGSATSASSSDATARTLGELREWDLWGPLLLCLALSTVLSLSASVGQSAIVFASVFAMVWLGAAVVTVNAYLLGADMCVLRATGAR
jgi:hypothetical protein